MDWATAGNWKDACRRTLQVAANFKGDDAISLRLQGQGLTMDFPNSHTSFCDDLIDQIERLPGIVRVVEG